MVQEEANYLVNCWAVQLRPVNLTTCVKVVFGDQLCVIMLWTGTIIWLKARPAILKTGAISWPLGRGVWQRWRLCMDNFTDSSKLDGVLWGYVKDNRTHYSDVTWVSYHLRSPATWMFVQQFVWAGIKERSKVCITGLLWRESTGNQWIPLTSASNVEDVSISWRHHKYNLIRENVPLDAHGFYQPLTCRDRVTSV